MMPYSYVPSVLINYLSILATKNNNLRFLKVFASENISASLQASDNCMPFSLSDCVFTKIYVLNVY